MSEQGAPAVASDVVRAGPVRLAIPPGWSAAPAPDAELLLVGPERAGFRASLAVTSGPLPAHPAAEHLGSVLVVAASAGALLAAEPFPAGGAHGWRVETVHRVQRDVVRATIWTAVTPDRWVEVTVSRALRPGAEGFAAVQRIASSLRIDGAVDGPAEPPAGPVPTGVVWPATGFPAISDAAWIALQRAQGHGFQPAVARSAEGVALREAGLMTRFGGTTPAAESLLVGAHRGERTDVRRRGGAGDAAWTTWLHQGKAVVDLGDVEGEPPRIVSHVLSRTGADAALVRVLQWMRMAPAFRSAAGECTRALVTAVDERLRGDVPAPDDAGPALAAAWAAGPWTAYDLGSHRAPGVLRLLRAGDGTWWTQGPRSDDGTASLSGVAASTVIDLLTGASPGA